MTPNAKIMVGFPLRPRELGIDAYQDPLCVADSPGEVADVSIRADNFRSKFDAEPGSRLVSIIGG